MARDDDDRPRRRRPVDDDDDDRPRKRRPVDDDEDEDRPRKRRVVDEDEDDDRPRKRRRDEDDDDDDRPRKKKKKGGKGLLIGLIAGGAVLVIGLVVLLIILLSGGGLASQILGKWKTELTLNGVIPEKLPPGFDPKVKMDIMMIAEFKSDGTASMDMEMKIDLGKLGSKGEKKKESGTYKIEGQYLLSTEKGKTEKVKVEIRGDEMTWSDIPGISAAERQDMKVRMGIDFPTKLTWKRIK